MILLQRVFLLFAGIVAIAGEGLTQSVAAAVVTVACLLYNASHQEMRQRVDKLNETNLLLFKERGREGGLDKT